jgi:chemotaxis protein histidine kinase CheA
VLSNPDPKKAKEIEIKLLRRLRGHGGNPKFKQLSERLDALKDRFEAGQINSVEFLKELLQIAKETEAKLADWKNALQHYETVLKSDSGNTRAKENREIVRKLIEELKKKQEQQKKNDKDKKKDQKDQKDKQDQKEKQDQNKDQQQSDQSQGAGQGQNDLAGRGLQGMCHRGSQQGQGDERGYHARDQVHCHGGVLQKSCEIKLALVPHSA